MVTWPLRLNVATPSTCSAVPFWEAASTAGAVRPITWPLTPTPPGCWIPEHAGSAGRRALAVHAG